MVAVVKSFDGEFDFLSNFHPNTPFSVAMFPDKRVEFTSGEHGYQAYKAFAVKDATRETVLDLVTMVADCDTPGEAKKVGRKINIDVPAWDAMKDYCMRTVVFEKFANNPVLQEKLLATGAAMLVEGNTWGDLYWGRCEGKGQNRLGAILIEVRGYHYFQQRMRPLSERSAHIMMGW